MLTITWIEKFPKSLSQHLQSERVGRKTTNGKKMGWHIPLIADRKWHGTILAQSEHPWQAASPFDSIFKSWQHFNHRQKGIYRDYGWRRRGRRLINYWEGLLNYPKHHPKSWDSSPSQSVSFHIADHNRNSPPSKWKNMDALLPKNLWPYDWIQSCAGRHIKGIFPHCPSASLAAQRRICRVS